MPADDPAPENSEILVLLDEFKESSGITYAELARRIGFSRQNLDLWRRRGIRTLPSAELIYGIAEAIGRDYNTVLTAALNDVGYLPPSDTLSSLRPTTAMELGTYAATIIGSGRERRAFSNPVTHLKTRGQTNPQITPWRAELHLTDADNPATTVVAGYVDFIKAKIGVPLPDLLFELPSDHGDSCDPHHFAALFDTDGELGEPLRELFGPHVDIFGSALLIENVFIDPAFRAYPFGPWLVADVIDRMTEETTDMVAMAPHVCTRVYPDTFFDEQILFAPTHPVYWRDLLHLESIVIDDTLMLVQATAFTALSEAREALAAAIDDQLFPIDVAELLDRHAQGNPLLWPLSEWKPRSIAPDVIFEQIQARALETALTRTLADAASARLAGLKKVLGSVNNSSAPGIEARLAAIVTFLGHEDSEIQCAGPFAHAALYLTQHPELVVDNVNWQTFEGPGGSVMYRLDVEVIPPEGELQ